MQPGAAIRRIEAFCLTLLAVLLLCAGCNLGVTPEGSSARFDGPPLIHIAAPQPNQSFLAGTTVILQARVENAGPDLARISVLLDNALLGEKLNPNESGATVLPLTIDWPTSNPGPFTLSVIAERADGTAAREDVTVVVIPRADPNTRPTDIPRPQDDGATDSQPEAKEPSADSASESVSDPAGAAQSDPTTIAPTRPPTVSGNSRVPGTLVQPSNLRLGPGTAHDLVGSLARDTEVMIVAVDPSHDWYRITYAELGDAWIYSELVNPASDISAVPVETGPSLPSENGVNLIVTAVEIVPNPPICGQTSTITATIRNIGNVDASNVGLIGWEILLQSSGAVIDSKTAAVTQNLNAGDETTVTFTETLSLHYNEEQRIRVTIDSGDLVVETDEADNAQASETFILAPGNCGA